jgi:hypothetical protein
MENIYKRASLKPEVSSDLKKLKKSKSKLSVDHKPIPILKQPKEFDERSNGIDSIEQQFEDCMNEMDDLICSADTLGQSFPVTQKSTKTLKNTMTI